MRKFLLIAVIAVFVSSISLTHGESNTVPSWIKNNAAWWAEGTLTDDDFLKGMQFLIKEGILTIPGYNLVPIGEPTQSTTKTSTMLDGTLYGPTKYLSFNDSPFFEISKNSQYFYLEDFEDGALNTLGVKVNNGHVIGPDDRVDSVDIDGDGLTDGVGSTGHSFWSDDEKIITFSFDEGKLGALPSFAGIVMTDVWYSNGDVYFEAYGPDGQAIDKIELNGAGDGSRDGTTDEDRFFGIVSDSGIKGIKIESSSSRLEVDHLQYGR